MINVCQINIKAFYTFIPYCICRRIVIHTHGTFLVSSSRKGTTRRDDTIFYYLDSVGDKIENLQSGLNWKWRTLKATANIYIKANKHAFNLATNSAKGASSLLTVVSTYVIANIWQTEGMTGQSQKDKHK